MIKDFTLFTQNVILPDITAIINPTIENKVYFQVVSHTVVKKKWPCRKTLDPSRNSLTNISNYSDFEKL